MRILVAEGRTLLREGLCALLEGHADFEVVGEAADSRAALEQARRLGPDVAVVGTELSEPFANSTVTEMVQGHLCKSVLALSGQEDHTSVLGALQAGARGYLVLSSQRSDLFEALEALSAGRAYLSPAIAHHAVLALSNPHPQPVGALALLSIREREILQCVAEGKISREIAHDLALSTRTVETHRANLMRKLGVNKASSLVRIAIREGLLDS